MAHKILFMAVGETFPSFTSVVKRMSTYPISIETSHGWFCPICHHQVEERTSAPNNNDDSFIFWACPRCNHHMRHLRHAIAVEYTGLITFPKSTTHVVPTTLPQMENR